MNQTGFSINRGGAAIKNRGFGIREQWMKVLESSKRHGGILVFIVFLCVYGISAGSKIVEQSKTPQYVHLANSFLHGHVDLISLPESKFDLISYQGKWYVPGGVTPALLLLPAVAVFGSGVSDVLFGVVLGALNVVLLYFLLGKLTDKFSTRIWLTILFGLGTVHWWLSSVGSVWFNAQLVACLFMILFCVTTLQNRPWLAGLCLGLAALARPPVLFSGIFFLLYTLYREPDLRPIIKKLIPFGVMTAAALAGILAYNYLRFGSPTDFGYQDVQGSQALTSTYAATGGFNIRYIPCNAYVSLLGPPNLDWNPMPGVNEVCPHLGPITHFFGNLSAFFNPLGMSIFLTTPAFLLIFRAKLKDDLVIPAWAGILSTLIPLWTYHTTGWVQFGYRYSLDFSVFLFILLSRAIKHTGILEKILIGISVIMGAIGLYLMYYMTFGLIWPEMFMELARKIHAFVF